MPIRLPVSILLTLTLSCIGHAEVFKWTDAQGNIHFGDQPPANRKSESLNIKSTPASSVDTPAPGTPLEREKKILKVMDDERAAKAENQKKTDQKRMAQQMECARLKDMKRQFDQGGRFYNILPNGERNYHTDEEISKRHQEVEQALTHCP